MMTTTKSPKQTKRMMTKTSTSAQMKTRMKLTTKKMMTKTTRTKSISRRLVLAPPA